MAFQNTFLYTNEDGDYESRQVQYALPVVETPQYTVYVNQELPELTYESNGELLVEIVLHEDL